MIKLFSDTINKDDNIKNKPMWNGERYNLTNCDSID